MRNLPPSLKKRKRYLAFRIISESNVSRDEFLKSLWNSMLSLFGEFESEIFKLIQLENNIGILMCSHRNLDKLKIALTLINKVGDAKALPITLGVSGTIRGCRKHLEVLKDADSADGI